MKKSTIIILAVVAVFGLYLFFTYNKLVTGDENIKNQWAQVETQYQRRFDLIPNLVESVKGIMEQEKEVFGALAEARTRYSGAQTVSDKAGAATQVESALSRLLVVVENYPDLRSVETVKDLMVGLEGTENRISVARQRYNEVVQNYNLIVKRIPGKWVAGLFSFMEANYFNAAPGSNTAPAVKF